jgi:S-(hydroxymethyl)glutathione dehydrogenase/alcohol dehydrogenase
VLVRVVASGICHSDLNVAAGNLPASPRPQVLGHEAAGIVERVGRAVRDFAPGDHVITCPSGFCGSCSWCMSGLLHLCTDKRRARSAGQPPRLSFEGQAVAQFAGLGGFAEQMLVHERAVAAIPAEMPFDRAALLGCAVVTGMGTVFNTAQVRPGQTPQPMTATVCPGRTCAVLNTVPIPVTTAHPRRAAKIIAVDLLAPKLDRAVRFGATDTVEAGTVDAVDAVRTMTGGGVDHAFEVVGRPATIAQAFEMLRNRGTATVVGVARPGDKVSIGALDLLAEKRLQGAQMGSSRFRLDVDLFARMYLDGRILLDELISERIDLDQLDSALWRMDDSTGARSVISFEPEPATR